jgi:hypothetical protein
MYNFNPTKPAWLADENDLTIAVMEFARIYKEAGHDDMLDAMFERNTYLANDNATIMQRYTSLIFYHWEWLTKMVKHHQE